MNKTDRILLSLYIATLVTLGLFALLFEVIRPDLMGCLFDENDRTMRSVFETISILFTLASIYGALKMMAIPYVGRQCCEEQGYLRWSGLRWACLAVSMSLCLFTYYLFLSTNVVAFLGICAIALFFVWPTSGRREREMSQFNDEYLKS